MYPNNQPLETVLCEKMRFSINHAMDLRSLQCERDVTARIDDTANYMVARLEVTLLGREVERVTAQWPADWWQAVRERWAPAWWLKRHPVKYQRIDRPVYNVCPHMNVPANQYGPTSRHVMFLAAKGVGK